MDCDTRLSCTHLFDRLKIKYRDFNAAIGQTGAGLKYEDVEEDSELANLIGKLVLLSLKACTHFDCCRKKAARISVLEGPAWLLEDFTKLQPAHGVAGTRARPSRGGYGLSPQSTGSTAKQHDQLDDEEDVKESGLDDASSVVSPVVSSW